MSDDRRQSVYKKTTSKCDRRSMIQQELERRESMKKMLHGDDDHVPDVRNNPTINRSCTDIFCIFLFLIMIAAWVILSIFAFSNSDINTLTKPWNTARQKCGVDKNVKDKPYLLFFDITACASTATLVFGCLTEQVCLKECPQENFFFFHHVNDGNWESERDKMICRQDFDTKLINSFKEAKELVDNGTCAKYYLKSDPFYNRCFPTDLLNTSMNAGKEFTDINLRPEELQPIYNALAKFGSAAEIFQETIKHLGNSWQQITIGLIVGMLLCLIFIVIMRYIAGPVIWFSILGCLGALGLVVYYSATHYAIVNNNSSAIAILKQKASRTFSPKHRALAELEANEQILLCILIISSIVFSIVLLLVIFLRKRIVIAIALVREGSKAVSSITASVFFPVIPWILELIVLGFGIVVFLLIMSGSDPPHTIKNMNNCVCTGPPASIYKEGSSCEYEMFQKFCAKEGKSCENTSCQFHGISTPYIKHILQFYNAFSMLWSTFFISAFGQMVLAATFSTWYWTFNKKNVPFFTVFAGIQQTIRYNLGTIAFGSLVITICRLIRAGLEYANHYLKKYDNRFIKVMLRCCSCFFWCLERFLKFLNKNAYIMCAIHGTNFCTSAKNAFELILRNCLRVAALDKVTDFLFFLAKILISVAMGAVMVKLYDNNFLIFTTSDNDINLHYYVAGIVAVGTYFIATIFFNVYSMAVDTLFLCFLDDSEQNDGSEERPYFMSKSLMKILGKKNVLEREEYAS